MSEAPDALDDSAAGGAPYAALSACAALRAAGLPPRPAPRPTPRAAAAPRVLLLGLGGVGHAALQLLVYSGARVRARASTARRHVSGGGPALSGGGVLQVTVGCAGEMCARALAMGAAAALDRHAADYDRQLEEFGP